MAGPLRAGEYRHRIEIQQQGTTRDSAGQKVETWTAFASNVPAAIETNAGREFFSGDREQAHANIRFRIRYLTGVVRAMRVSFDSRLFDIEAAPDIDQRQREMHLICVERL